MDATQTSYIHESRLAHSSNDMYLPPDADASALAMPQGKAQNYTIRKNVTAASAGFWGDERDV